MPRTRLLVSAWGAAVPLLLLAGCGPKILAFDVQPRRVCAGDSVHITWNVRGTPRLVAVRRTEDSVDIIRYTIIAESHGKQAFSQMDVITFTPGVPAALAFNTDMLGHDSLVARDTLRAATWHDLLRVGDITSDSGRQVLVRHAGIDGVVGPGREGNAAWRGKLMSGPWEVRSGLKPGEVPGNPTHHPPTHLFLKMSLVCDGRGAQP